MHWLPLRHRQTRPNKHISYRTHVISNPVMHTGELIKSQWQRFFLFCYACLSRTPLTPLHYNVTANPNGKGPCLYIPLPILADLPIKGHHYIWPYYCCLCCSQKQEGTGTQPQMQFCGSHNSTIYLKIHAVFPTLDFSITVKYCCPTSYSSC